MFSPTILLLILLFISLLSIITFRLKLHPLSKYPGPIIAKLTDFYGVYHAFSGNSHINNKKLHQTYGKFVRTGPNRLSINSAGALHAIHNIKANVQKSDFYSVFPSNPKAPSVHSSINKRIHARKRRVMNHGFSEATLYRLEPDLQTCVETFLTQLGEGTRTDSTSEEGKWSKPFDMASMSNNFTFDAMGAMIFGTPFGMMTSATSHWVKRAITTTSYHKYSTGHVPLLLHWKLDQVFMPHLAKSRERFRHFAASLVETAVAGKLSSKQENGNEKSDDLLTILGEAIDPETDTKFTPAELGSESAFLITAGSDTSSTALVAVFWYFCQDKQALARCREEIQGTFANSGEIKIGKRLQSCVFLRAVIDESMRLAPPVPGILWREVLPGGIVIDGEYIPAGVDVGVPPYTLMRNPAYYKDNSQRFRPERWLGRSGEVAAANFAFCPFSIGPRECIAKRLAYVELALVLARTLWTFDLRPVEGTVGGDAAGNYRYRDCFVTEKVGPMVQFRRRNI